MTILTVALKYLRGRLVASTLTAVSITLGVSLVVASVLLARGIKEGFIAGATEYNHQWGGRVTAVDQTSITLVGAGDVQPRRFPASAKLVAGERSNRYG